MDKYTILTFIGGAIILALALVNTFVYEIPNLVYAIIDTIAIIIMVLGIYYRKRK